MFSAATYAERRAALLARLKESGATGIVFFPGNVEVALNYDANNYPFRQDSTFLYYFGHDQAGLNGTVDIDSGDMRLWGDDLSMDDIIWSGPKPDIAERAERCACSAGGNNSALVSMLHAAKKSGRTIHFLPPYRISSAHWVAYCIDEQLSTKSGTDISALKHASSLPLIQAVVAQRSVKTIEEVTEMEKALGISYAMYSKAMELARAGLGERCIAAAIDSTVALGGSRNSFTTICTVRGEVLHNHDYSNIMHQGDLLLIDSGAESDLHYASDITRTLPVGGLFSSRQKDVYSLVLKAQQTAIGMAGPGVAYRDCHFAAVTCIASGLKDMGLLRGNVDDIVREGAHALFMPHGLGHMIGLDVHDMEHLGEEHVGYDETCTRSAQFGLRSLRFARRLRTGFTVTVEPGCYFIPALMDKWKAEGICKDFINHDALEHFRDFGGIRIEDDILVTDSGCRILGRPIPKTPEGIEARMHARS